MHGRSVNPTICRFHERCRNSCSSFMYSEGPTVGDVGLAVVLRPGSRCMLSRIVFEAVLIESSGTDYTILILNGQDNSHNTEKLLHNRANQFLVLGQILENDFGSNAIRKRIAQVLDHAACLLGMIVNGVGQLGVANLGGVRNICAQNAINFSKTILVRNATIIYR